MNGQRDAWAREHQRRENRFRASVAAIALIPLLVLVGLVMFGSY